MNLKEFYEASGGDYEATVQRIRNEDMLKKFVMKYAADPSYSNLTAAVDDKDWEPAFRLRQSFLRKTCADRQSCHPKNYSRM